MSCPGRAAHELSGFMPPLGGESMNRTTWVLWIGDPVMRPGEPRAIGEHGVLIDHQLLVVARAKLAAGIGCGAVIVGEPEDPDRPAGGICFAVGRRVEALRLHR